jgi:hypothetical protein
MLCDLDNALLRYIIGNLLQLEMIIECISHWATQNKKGGIKVISLW